jgi:hypothetical protein
LQLKKKYCTIIMPQGKGEYKKPKELAKTFIFMRD